MKDSSAKASDTDKDFGSLHSSKTQSFTKGSTKTTRRTVLEFTSGLMGLITRDNLRMKKNTVWARLGMKTGRYKVSNGHRM